MTKEYIIGVDIGATKSHLALFDTTGIRVDLRRWGALNHEMLPGSFAQLEDELKQFTARTLAANGVRIEQIACAVIGAGGVDTKRQHVYVSGILHRLGFRRFTLCNDSYLGIFAGSPTGTGICAINGTGYTLAGLDRSGGMLQIGGVGAISDDVGGGGYISNRVAAAVYNELFRKAEPTCMTPLLFEKLNVSSKYDYLERLCAAREDGSLSLADCVRMAFTAVGQNDGPAAKILRDVAESYANGISGMLGELDFPPDDELCIVLAGSVFVKVSQTFLIDELKAKVGRDNPGYRVKYTLPSAPNVAGAIIWALNMLHGGGGYIDRVCGQFGRDEDIPEV